MMLSTSHTKASLTVLTFVLVFFASVSVPQLSPPVALGDSGIISQPTVKHSLRPTMQALGDPRKGPPGSTITVQGSGLRGFASVESIELGGINILGNRTVSTNREGNFQVDGLIVPGLDPGIVSLVVKVGTGDLQTTSVSTFEVTDPTNGSPAPGVPVATALESLGDALERVFHFDNGTKTWSFFDPRRAFFDSNDLAEIVEGQVYWVKVARSVTATLNAKERNLTCSNEGTLQEDCWNLVVW